MKWSELTVDQLEWLNRQYAVTARRMARIVQRLDAAKLDQADPIYAIIMAHLHTTYAVCEVTHAALNRRRPAPSDPFKPGGYERQRLAAEDRERQQRAAIERGRADPPKPAADPAGYEDRPY